MVGWLKPPSRLCQLCPQLPGLRKWVSLAQVVGLPATRQAALRKPKVIANCSMAAECCGKVWTVPPCCELIFFIRQVLLLNQLICYSMCLRKIIINITTSWMGIHHVMGMLIVCGQQDDPICGLDWASSAAAKVWVLQPADLCEVSRAGGWW